MSSYRTIKLKRYQDIVNEETAGGAIIPGALVKLNSDDEVVVHATAGGPAGVRIALEDELQGNTTRDAYADGDVVQVWDVQPGEEFLGLVASNYDPDIGALVESEGAGGRFRAHSAGTALAEVTAAKVIDDADTPNHRVALRRI